MTNEIRSLRISLDDTRALHAEISASLPRSAGQIATLIENANRSIRARGITFGGEKEMPIAFSSLQLTRADAASLQAASETLHGILEKVLDWLAEDPSRLERHCADHRRIFPFLGKVRGARSWQLFSRYDAVVAPDGGLTFIECNTGCPAGFMHAIDFTEETHRAMSSFGLSSMARVQSFGMMKPGALVDMLLEVEDRSGIEKNLVAILTDENELKLELDLIERDLLKKGRRARVIDARSLEFVDGRLIHRGEPISLTFNKVRISTPLSPNHCWKEGFEDRYLALLSAIRRDAVVSINGLAALTIAEDKGMLAHLHSAEIRSILSEEERAFVDANVAWTARLVPGRVDHRGRDIDLIPTVLDNKDAFVLKPANEGRGFEVHVGRDVSPQEWRRLCQPRPELPMVVQEFIQPHSMEVVCLRNGAVRSEKMYLTVALGVLHGQYSGILSRISPSIVTNVGRQGFVQAVFLLD